MAQALEGYILFVDLSSVMSKKREKQHTSNIRGDVPIPSSPSLGEETTAPVYETRSRVPTTTARMGRELENFLHREGAPHLIRGMPRIARIVFDTEHDLPHIWIELRMPFPNATEATKSLIRQELEDFADQIWWYFEEGFALSVILE